MMMKPSTRLNVLAQKYDSTGKVYLPATEEHETLALVLEKADF
jgi:hypothetical protein